MSLVMPPNSNGWNIPLKKGTPCTSIMLAEERDIPCIMHIHTAGGGRG
jgi:hypothetical protein